MEPRYISLLAPLALIVTLCILGDMAVASLTGMIARDVGVEPSASAGHNHTLTEAETSHAQTPTLLAARSADRSCRVFCRKMYGGLEDPPDVGAVDPFKDAEIHPMWLTFRTPAVEQSFLLSDTCTFGRCIAALTGAGCMYAGAYKRSPLQGTSARYRSVLWL